MCTKVLVCHGDMVEPGMARGAYTPEQRALKQQIASMNNDDCRPATFYVTRDGKYAVDADFVSLADMNDPDFDLDSVPKIKLAGD